MNLGDAILLMEKRGLDPHQVRLAVVYIGGRMQLDVPEDVVEEAIQYKLTGHLS